ncbi:BcSNF1, Snf1-like protein kinase [Calycina marina]|uniref:non-specific serine/threonine protein kinase n=1 Tax=Calycina marina TaxID=1763456 RepID=A0A9P7ZAN6_9HELO|nr:BcSNF1, Snf1-like protein kinase [Calycina marina]
MNSSTNGKRGFDIEDLEISLAPSANRRANTKPPDASNSRYNEITKHQLEVESQAEKKNTEVRIGQYRVVRTLGEGSFGKVKLAVHTVTGQQVALKIIARRKLISRDMAGRVEREIEYLQLLRHPHIIKLYTVIKTQSEIIMVLEYAGGELFNYVVDNGKMTDDNARRFFQQIMCAVEYCHRHKIVHRDLKPENLLLDDQLNIKIADFGLSNIMTDGNFLKTSCGSPNYAAPEVINGKLYAGPEVDVWSCGVILFVLLVGRLPFDDEHIPSLFSKIAKGIYTTPAYVSTGAADLIHKCLAVNPVNRITIDDIRLHPWFAQDLPLYLQLPVEEFIDTGVDPTKAINSRDFAPRETAEVSIALHDEVTEKISRTMGYAVSDVQEALAANEPSAIKDAYLIVRENKLMAANPLLAEDDPEGINPWTGAQSPPGPEGPAPVAGMSFPPPGFSIVSTDGSKDDFGNLMRPAASPLIDALSPRSSSSITTTKSSTTPRTYVSTIGILPSSVPSYHRALRSAKKAGDDNPVSNLSTSHSENHQVHPQSDAEKVENARRLNPHSRSQAKIEEAGKRSSVPGMTPVEPKKKSKPIKWQFGIRSRSQPLEAMGCIYRALRKLGATWLNEEFDVERMENFDRQDAENGDQGDGGSLHHENSMHHSSDENMGVSSGGRKPKFVERRPGVAYKLPSDPWIIHVRWTKTGLYPPGVRAPTSTHSSTADLRRQSIASLSSNGGSSYPSSNGTSPPNNEIRAGRTASVTTYMDIQLYEMERGVYLVDFKCVGYERPDGTLLVDKEVSSPFPFLEQAADLIIALADQE